MSLMYLIGRNMFTSDNIKLSEVIFIWFLALSSTLYPALIEFVGFCFICSFCLSFLLSGMIGLLDLKTILTLSSTSYSCAVYRSAGQWQKFIHYKHVPDYHKFDWCLPWAYPEVCFLFLIITNIGYLVFYFLCLSQIILNFSIYQNISDSACIIISEQKVFRIVSAYCFLSL